MHVIIHMLSFVGQRSGKHKDASHLPSLIYLKQLSNIYCKLQVLSGKKDTQSRAGPCNPKLNTFSGAPLLKFKLVIVSQVREILMNS